MKFLILTNYKHLEELECSHLVLMAFQNITTVLIGMWQELTNTMDNFLKVFYKFNWIISITLEKYNI